MATYPMSGAARQQMEDARAKLDARKEQRHADIPQWEGDSKDWKRLTEELVDSSMTRIVHGDGSETVVGMCEDDSDSIFIGWLGPGGDCNWFYSDSEDAHKIMQGLNKVLNCEH